MYGLVGQDPHMYEGTRFQSDSFGDYYFYKAGMINYTRYLAARHADSGIRVNCISPGGCLTNQPEEFLDRYNRRVPLGRMANEDDIKGAVVYLASDASAYVTGHNLVVDGGWTIW
jgi:NAD(P)-dependent dehydrogenase (short-subunit alcohol dehydrogenase family)